MLTQFTTQCCGETQVHLAQPVCVPFTLSFDSPFTKLHRKFALAPETY